MKKKGLLTVFMCIVMSAALLCGCGNTTDRPGLRAPSEESRGRDESTAQESMEETIDPETMELIKYNIYIELNNYIVEVLDNIDYYYMVVDYADEFSLIQDSGLSYGFSIYYLNTDILEDAEMVADMEPSYGNLDTMTRDIIEPMRTMMEVFNSINKSNDYADNQYAKAKEWHKVIMENAEDFYAMGLDYLDAVSEMADEQVAKDEAKMLEEGRLIIYNSSHAITLANQILDECYAQGIDDYNLTELDLEPVKALYDELVATVEAYDAAVSDNNQLIKESLSDSAPFDGLLDSLVQSVEWMMKQVESGQPVTDIDLTPLGSMGHVGEVLSQCIDRYNSVFADM